ncbi:nucleotidyltransferase family protein [Synechococcus sp. BDU 130192]|uniref:nucleotidyltransferase family protein n=1 Tax=Synechococcus sp. BDU 130192 TaxID=2042059 RepID=UPI000C06BF2D|nr:nucleotidyltransferase domain-containing protein [Synechococcus sp. BDU 130192]
MVSQVALIDTLKIELLNALCQQWKIQEFSVFGSIVQGGFSEESDVDCLVKFSEDADWDLLDIIKLKQKLSDLFGRPVDLIEQESISNPFILRSIKENHRILYSSHG